MCGIAGVVSSKGIDPKRLEAMSDVIAHRGPDGCGQWVSPNGQVGLAHRRLSIIDLSPAGAQPMASSSGRYTITFNGEIYNFADLRKTLETEQVHFHGHSDTEVMLACFERWGIVQTLPKLDGMFAFAVWDAQEQTLTLTRDRVGIKPLFFSTAEGELVFASELRPLVTWWGKLPAVSAEGLTEFMRLGYVPGGTSILEGVKKLPPGTYAVYHNNALSSPQAYWRLSEAVRTGMNNSFTRPDDALKALDVALRQSVASHMVSDVPLGAFLSGGIDSSTVTALMQAQSTRPIKTFSIGFNEVAYNEAAHAAAVAKHLGTEHTEMYVTDTDARDVIPLLPDIYDEPFADVSQIPTFLLSKLTRQHVTVALSGDGGDELFAGYNRYVFVSDFWENLQRLPLPVRKTIARLLTLPGNAAWDKLFALLAPVLPARLNHAMPGHKIAKIAKILPSTSLLALHTRLVSQWAVPENALHPAYRAGEMLWAHAFNNTPSLVEPAQQMLWDMKTYLVDDILTKVDRASMRVGLEARVPLLDHHVVELAWRVPLEMKLRGGGGKWLLKQLLYKYVPKELVERPKMGFGVPIDAWLRGPLREWAEHYLSAERLAEEGFFDVSTIRRTWEEHCKGSVDRGGQLWTVLMFQLWLERARKWV